MHQTTARQWHARAIKAFSRGESRSARVSLKHAADEFRAAGDRANAALVDAMIAFAEAEDARAALAIGEAHVAASRAWAAAHRAGNEPFAKEVERFEALLSTPLATNGEGTTLDSAAISDLLKSPNHIVVDGLRARVFLGGKIILDLSARPLLVQVLSSLACGTPITSRALAIKVFAVRSASPAHETRLKSQLTLMRKLTKRKLGDFTFEEHAFHWQPKLPVIVLAPLAPLLETHIESFLLQRKSSSARALAKSFGQSVASTKKALDALAKRGSILAIAKARTVTGKTPKEQQYKVRSAIDALHQVQLF